MLKVDTSELERLSAGFKDADKRHIPFAAARTLTQVAENARMDGVREMKSKLHAPTNWTLQALWKAPATKTNLASMVYLKDAKGGREYVDGGRLLVAAGQGKKGVLSHLFDGGNRNLKGFERAMRNARLIDNGTMIVPGAGAPLDAHGNIPRGFIVQMLAYFKGLRESKDWMTDKGRARFGKRQGKKVGVGGAAVEYFISRGRGNWFGRRSWKNGMEQHLPPGIWMRAQAGSGRTALKPIIMFIRKAPSYKQIIDLETIAQTALARDFDPLFQVSMDDALRTAI